MVKTLLIKYLPSGAWSKTKKLLDIFLKEIDGQEVETLDLLQYTPPIFTEASIGAYYKRNYQGQTLTADESALLAENDRLIAQFKSADVVVIAAPFHNFGIPGVVKLYLDAIIFNHETFELGQKPLAGKRALALFTSGGVYDPVSASLTAGFKSWDTYSQVFKINFTFMGFDKAEVVATSLQHEESAEQHLKEAGEKIKAVVAEYYA